MVGFSFNNRPLGQLVMAPVKHEMTLLPPYLVDPLYLTDPKHVEKRFHGKCTVQSVTFVFIRTIPRTCTVRSRHNTPPECSGGVLWYRPV